MTRSQYDMNIGVRAVAAGLITSAQLAEAIAEAKRLKSEGEGGDLGCILVSKGYLTEEQANDLGAKPPTTPAQEESDEESEGTVEMNLEDMEAEADSLVGQLLGGDFKIVKKLGSGGMGSVYLAEQVGLRRKVAVKVIAPDLAKDTEYVARFKREATSAAQLVHPNITQVYAIGEHRGMWYIAMEYVEGKSAGDMLKDGGPMDVGLAANIIAQALKGLSRAHSLNIIHRDIKPDNLMISKSGEVKIADFGLARMSAQHDVSLTMSGAVMGTPHYMSPQQAEGEQVNQQADIYSLGATFYHMVTGSTPFEGDSAMSILYKAGTSKPEPAYRRNAKVPLEVSRLIEKMMARNLAARYATCDDALKDLNALGFLGKTPAQADARKRRVIPLLAGAVVLVLITAGIALNWERIAGKRPAVPETPQSKPAAEQPAPSAAVEEVARKPEARQGGAARVPDTSGKEPTAPKQPPAPVVKPTAIEPAAAPPVKPAPESPKPKPEQAVSRPKGPDVKPAPPKKIEPPKPKPIDQMQAVARKLNELLPPPPPQPEAVKIITVRAEGPAPSTALMDAVSAVPLERGALKDPTRIDVYPGVYEGTIKIGGDNGWAATREKPLHLRAIGDAPVIITPGADANMLWVNRTDFVSIEGFLFEGGGDKLGINLMYSRFFHIRECVFAGCKYAVFSFWEHAGDSASRESGEEGQFWEGSEFSDCLFIENQSAIFLSDLSEMRIRNNIFADNTEAAINLERFKGSILLNIFSLPPGARAIGDPGETRLSGTKISVKNINYNCYAGPGNIFVSGRLEVQEIKDWESRYRFDEDSFRGAPGFRDEKSGDFRLAGGSKCSASLPKDSPMGVRWSDQRWQIYLKWWKGRKK